LIGKENNMKVVKAILIVLVVIILLVFIGIHHIVSSVSYYKEKATDTIEEYIEEVEDEAIEL